MKYVIQSLNGLNSLIKVNYNKVLKGLTFERAKTAYKLIISLLLSKYFPT